MAHATPPSPVPDDRRGIAEQLGIPVSAVTDTLLSEIAESPLFLHHLQMCKDDPQMLALLLGTGQNGSNGQNGQNGPPAGSPAEPAAPAAVAPGNGELAARAGVALARWARSGFTRVPDDAYQARLAACQGCPQLTAPGQGALHRLTGTGRRSGVCGLCGCDVARKARLATEDCPDGRWETIAP